MNTRTLLAIVACTLAMPAAAGPDWTSRKVTEVRVLDNQFKVVRIISDRAELDAFATWFQRAHEVKGAGSASGHAWSHKLDIDAPGGGRWLYDAASGDFTVLSMKRAQIYRLEPADKGRFAALMAAGTPRSSVDANRTEAP